MNIEIMRIYMPQSAKVKDSDSSFWRKFFGETLADFLLRKAKAFGIDQAVYQRVIGGYIKKGKLAFDIFEVTPPSLPQCVELIDKPDRLKEFAELNKRFFENCRVVSFNAEQLIDAIKSQ